MKRTPNLEIRIDRLLVEGADVSPHHARRIHTAIEQELTALFARETTPQAELSGAIPTLRAPEINPGGRQGPAELGRAIARSIHALISGTP